LHKLLPEFLKLAEAEDREKCVSWALDKVRANELDIVTLYSEILAPSLNDMKCKDSEAAVCIWKEHVRSSIVRTVIESCYPLVLKERAARGARNSGVRAVVVCPSEELHEIGARMVADYFTLCGFEVTFVGANTPLQDFLAAVDVVRPKYICVSATNHYNLVAARKVISKIRAKAGKDVTIVVGGRAFQKNPETAKAMGADLLLDTFEDIRRLGGC
jgi:methanogenic corrinoid protein MtbC1